MVLANFMHRKLTMEVSQEILVVAMMLGAAMEI